jgi:isopentenyl-diphosphate delta-isomerase
MEKIEAHRKAHLHRAFSVFIFNSKGEMLLQQRAPGKYHSGGLWTNACCSHPLPGENILEAAKRRLSEEMGFETDLRKIFDFIYRADFSNGLTEYEFDHVFIGTYENVIYPDKNEVSDFCFKSMEEISDTIKNHGKKFTSWFKIAFPMVEKWVKENK